MHHDCDVLIFHFVTLVRLLTEATTYIHQTTHILRINHHDFRAGLSFENQTIQFGQFKHHDIADIGDVSTAVSSENSNYYVRYIQPKFIPQQIE